MEKTTGQKPGIKWVNDVLVNGKKICGILTEAIPRAVIVGIGVNINLSEDVFPAGLRESAGSISMDKDTRARFFSALTDEIFRCVPVAEKTGTAEAIALMDEYRKRSVLIGKPVILTRGDAPALIQAFCETITDDGALVVVYDNGYTEELRTSEVSVRLGE